MKKQIKNILNIVLALIFVIAFIWINKINVIIILLSLLFFILFKKLNNSLLNVKNKSMFYFLGFVELFFLGIIMTSFETKLSSSFVLSIIAMLFSIVIIFLIFKKKTNHSVTIYTVLLTLMILLSSFISGINMPILIIAPIIPMTSYIVNKFIAGKSQKKSKVFIICIGYALLILEMILYNK